MFKQKGKNYKTRNKNVRTQKENSQNYKVHKSVKVGKIKKVAEAEKYRGCTRRAIEEHRTQPLNEGPRKI